MGSHRIESADGISLHVEADGPEDGPAVLLVHGWPDTHRIWDAQIAPLVDAGYRVIRHDQRGFGASGRPDDVAGYHVFNAMADLGSIMDHLEIKAAHLVGHDWGAPPCWLAAMLSPDRVQSLTAVSVGHPIAFKKSGVQQMQKSFYMLLFQFEEIAEEWLQGNNWANFRAMFGRSAASDARIAALSEPGALTASLNWYRANAAPESLIEEPPKLPPVTVRTMGVMGRNDTALLPHQMENSAQFMAADWRYELLDAGHWIQQEDPDTFNALLREWFAADN